MGVTRAEGRQFYGYGQVVLNGKNGHTANTVFEIGSVTKTFTATILTTSVRTGVVRLDNPAPLYLHQPGNCPSGTVGISRCCTWRRVCPETLPALLYWPWRPRSLTTRSPRQRQQPQEGPGSPATGSVQMRCSSSIPTWALDCWAPPWSERPTRAGISALLKAHVSGSARHGGSAIAAQRRRFRLSRSLGRQAKQKRGRLRTWKDMAPAFHSPRFVDLRGRLPGPAQDAVGGMRWALAIQALAQTHNPCQPLHRPVLDACMRVPLAQRRDLQARRSFLGFVPEKKLGVVVLSEDSVDDIGISYWKSSVAERR